MKKATEKDASRLLKLANTEPCINLFIIGDIETYGFDKDYQEIWYDEKNGEITNIYLRYRDNAVIYSKDNDFDVDEIVTWLKEQKINHLNTCGRNGDAMWEALKLEFNVEPTFMCELRNFDKIIRHDIVSEPSIEDAEAIAHELAQIDEFASVQGVSVEELTNRLKRNFEEGRKTVCVKEDGKIASFAQISVESSTAGMIVSVFTPKQFRGKGYAKACVATICAMLKEQGKTACLFYDNPSAGRIYHSLGFETVDTFNMYMRKERI